MTETGFTWEELSDVVHTIKKERVVIITAIHELERFSGTIDRLKKQDKRLSLVENKLYEIIDKHKEPRQKGSRHEKDHGSWS